MGFYGLCGLWLPACGDLVQGGAPCVDSWERQTPVSGGTPRAAQSSPMEDISVWQKHPNFIIENVSVAYGLPYGWSCRQLSWRGAASLAPRRRSAVNQIMVKPGKGDSFGSGNTPWLPTVNWLQYHGSLEANRGISES